MTITHDIGTDDASKDKYTHQDIVKLIESLIKKEHNKRPKQDWEVIAAQRIYATMDSMGAINKKKVK